jgi:hypothetical protein
MSFVVGVVMLDSVNRRVARCTEITSVFSRVEAKEHHLLAGSIATQTSVGFSVEDSRYNPCD